MTLLRFERVYDSDAKSAKKVQFASKDKINIFEKISSGGSPKLRRPGEKKMLILVFDVILIVQPPKHTFETGIFLPRFSSLCSTTQCLKCNFFSTRLVYLCMCTVQVKEREMERRDLDTLLAQ